MNKVLRSLWTEITLDGSMQPTRAEWRDATWRADEVEDWPPAS